MYAERQTETDWTGQVKRLSGYNWFIRINVRRLLAGSVINATPPIESWTYPDFTFEAFNNLNVLEFGWTVPYGWHSEFGVLEIRSTYPQSAGRNLNLPEVNTIGRPSVYDQYWSSGLTDFGFYTFFYRIIDGCGIVSQWRKAVFELKDES
jgi:hypothetical protein